MNKIEPIQSDKWYSIGALVRVAQAGYLPIKSKAYWTQLCKDGKLKHIRLKNAYSIQGKDVLAHLDKKLRYERRSAKNKARKNSGEIRKDNNQAGKATRKEDRSSGGRSEPQKSQGDLETLRERDQGGETKATTKGA